MRDETSTRKHTPADQIARVAFTVPEAAAAAGLSRATIDRAIRSGKLPVHYVGRKPLIRPVDLSAWITGAPGWHGANWARARERQRKAAERGQAGFTLIELLVVVVIIGILAGIAIPVFLNQKAKAYDASVKADLKSLALTAETYAADANGYGAQASDAPVVFSSPTSNGNSFWVDVLVSPTPGYIIYGKNAGSSRVFVLSSLTGSKPAASVATTLPTSTSLPADPAGTVTPAGSGMPVMAYGAPIGASAGAGTTGLPYDPSITAPSGLWAGIVSWRTAGWGGATCASGSPVYSYTLTASWGAASGGPDGTTQAPHTADTWNAWTLSVAAQCVTGGRIGAAATTNVSG